MTLLCGGLIVLRIDLDEQFVIEAIDKATTFVK